MEKPRKNKQDREFEKTVKRLLETPPKPHGKSAKDQGMGEKKPVKD